MGIITEREDLYATHLTRPVTRAMDAIIRKSSDRFPNDDVIEALMKTPDLTAALLGLSFVYSQIGGVQLVLEIVELTIRKICERDRLLQ